MTITPVRMPTRTIEIAAVSDDEIIAFTRSGWGKGHAVVEAARIAKAESKAVRLTHNGNVCVVPVDYFDEG